MSYDAIVLVPLLLSGNLAALAALFSRGSLRLGLALAALVAGGIGLASGVQGLESLAKPLPLHTGWDREVAAGYALWTARERAGGYLGWSLLPILPAVVAMVAWAREPPRSGRRRAVAAAFLAVPLLLAFALGARWIAPYTAGVWPVDDIRWEWGYVATCLEAPCGGRELAIACERFERIGASEALAPHVTAERLAAAAALCRGR